MLLAALLLCVRVCLPTGVTIYARRVELTYKSARSLGCYAPGKQQGGGGGCIRVGMRSLTWLLLLAPPSHAGLLRAVGTRGQSTWAACVMLLWASCVMLLTCGAAL